MPRKPAKESLKNPLRILRALCSEHGEARPLTQSKLGQLTGIAPDYIRSIENNRRPLNENPLDKIRYSTGAVWDPKQKFWTVNGLPNEPFTYEWFTRYRTLWEHDQVQVDTETSFLCRRLQAVLESAEPQDYNFIFDRLNHYIEGIRKEFKVGAARKVFDDATFEIEYHRDLKTDEILAIGRKFKLRDDKGFLEGKDGEDPPVYGHVTIEWGKPLSAIRDPIRMDPEAKGNPPDA